MNTTPFARRRVAMLATLTALAAPMSGAMAATTDDLPMAWPESVGVDARPLVRLSEWIRQQDLDVRSFVVVEDGKVIFERYSRGVIRDHNDGLYSITKNVTAMAAGALIEEGRSRLDEKVAAALTKARPDLKDAFADKQAIELRHVLSMSTGLVYNFKPTDDPICYGAPNNKAHAKLTPAGKRALTHELAAAAERQGRPGAPVDPTDTPKL
jgi:CubicO group peptidase (beta-lactamase class C family)